MSGLLALLVLLQLFPPTSPEPVLDLTGYAGAWWRHGINLDVSDNGVGIAVWRTYRWCAIDTPPCDRMEGDAIVSGGQGVLMLTERTADGVAGQIVSTTDPKLLHLGPVVLRLVEDGDGLDVEQGVTTLGLCGPAMIERRARRCGA